MNYNLFKIASPLIILCFCFAQCKKQPIPKTELEKLPPITQTGAYTFGCLINGVAYTPGGGGLLYQVLKVQYDATFQGGKLGVTAERVFDNGKSLYISIGGDSIHTVGIYALGLKTKFSIFYDDSRTVCTFHTFYDAPISGVLNITKFDNATRIISGTFAFKFTNANCGTIEATDGRFDIKY